MRLAGFGAFSGCGVKPSGIREDFWAWAVRFAAYNCLLWRSEAVVFMALKVCTFPALHACNGEFRVQGSESALQGFTVSSF